MNLSPGERLAASARDEEVSAPPVKTSALSRILNRKSGESTSAEEPSTSADEQVASSDSSSTIARGRLFSAIVDRFPSRQKVEGDPFLEGEIEIEEPETRTAQAAEPESRANRDHSLSRRSLTRSAPTEQTDAELWRSFASDADADHVTHDDPTLAEQEPAAAGNIESLPEWARPQTDDAARRPVAAAPARTASSSTATGADRNRFVKFGAQRAAVGNSAGTLGAPAAGKELQNLVSQARHHEDGSAMPKVRKVTAAAEHAQIQFGGTDELRSHSSRDPFADPIAGDAEQSSLRGATPFAQSGSSDADSAPWSTRVQPEQPVAPAPAPAFAREWPKPATPFPSAPEWRGVRANSPVSLAVVEQTAPEMTIEDSSRVRHADVTNDAASRLLPRSLPEHDPIFSSNEQSLALTAPQAEQGPLLAPPLVTAPISIAPGPAPEVDLAGQPLLAADETHDRSSGHGGWIVGGVLLAAALWLFGFGKRGTSRRHSAADRQ